MSSPLLGLATVAATVVALVVAAAAGVLHAEVRAQDAADAAALAAAHATRSAGPPVAAARSAAAAAGARLVACDCSGPVVRVTVLVTVDARVAVLAGVGDRRASAAARLVPPP